MSGSFHVNKAQGLKRPIFRPLSANKILAMRVLFCWSFFVVLISCNRTAAKSSSVVGPDFATNASGEFVISKVDSLDNFYLIYAVKHDSVYKIFSEKAEGRNCRKIYAGERHDFTLENAKNQSVITEDGVKKSFYLFNVDCMIYNDSTQICIERGAKSVPAIFQATNLKGLCITERLY